MGGVASIVINAPGLWVEWVRTWCEYGALGKLWSIVTTAVPEVRLPGDARVEGIEYALYRRVIEIRDGQRALRAWADPDLVDQIVQGVGCSNPRRAAVLAEAAELVAALGASRHRTYPSGDNVPRWRPAADLHVEARWLIRTSHRLARVRRRPWNNAAALPQPTIDG